MAEASKNDPALSRFRDAVTEVYGDRVEHLVLFGSRARGDSRPDSDYDIAVFLRGMSDRAQEMNRLADIGTDILYEVGRVIHAMPYSAEAYGARTPIMHQIRLDGIEL